jgi:glycosyltransferase involved in cell wall biosynthesis
MNKSKLYLHITPTEFKNETRIIKESYSLIKSENIDRVKIIAMHSKLLKKKEHIGNSIEVFRLRLISKFLPKNIIFQIIKLLEFILRVLFITLIDRPRVIAVHALWLLPLGIILKFFVGGKLVYDAHELETETYVLTGVRKSISKYVERVCIKYVDLVLVVSNGIMKWYQDKYNINYIVTVKNSPQLQTYKKTKLLHEELKLNHEKKILLYLGGFVVGRGIEELLDSFIKISNKEYAIVFMGYGELDILIIEYASKFPDIHLMQAVPPSEVTRFASSADIGVAFIDNGSLNDHYCLPNKFFEYIFSGLPVIVNSSPEMANIVNQYGIGVVLDNLNENTLASSLIAISNLDFYNFSNGILTAIQELCWEKQEIILLEAHQKFIYS